MAQMSQDPLLALAARKRIAPGTRPLPTQGSPLGDTSPKDRFAFATHEALKRARLGGVAGLKPGNAKAATTLAVRGGFCSD